MKRIDDLEFRWSETNENYELIQWFDRGDSKYCIVIVFYNKMSEGYEISFVGERPFHVEDQNLLWKMLKYGQSVCNSDFDFDLEE